MFINFIWVFDWVNGDYNNEFDLFIIVKKFVNFFFGIFSSDLVVGYYFEQE